MADTSGRIPGVAERVLVAPTELAQAHQRELEGVSYTRVWTERSTAGGDLRWETTARVRIAPDGRTHTVLEVRGPDQPATVPGDATRVEQYSENGQVWTAVWRGDTVSIRSEGARLALGQTALEPVLSGVALRVVERGQSGEADRIRLRGTEVRNETALELATPFHDPVNPRLTVVVTSQGIVRSYEFTYALANPPYLSEERFTRSFRVEAIDETTVSRPDWVPEPEQNATATAAG